MSQNIIEVKNISKTFKLPTERVDSLRDRILGVFSHNSFKEFKALEDISFEVKRGEFLGIIGKNGSGKSTLLKILAGVYEPDKGKVIVRGKISPFLELGVGFNGELSARDNIYLNGTILGLSEKQIDEKFDRIIEFAELQDFVETKVKNFSSGMYARLAFSVAIEAEADIYLMDEVLAVGDANFQAKCFAKFDEIIASGKTIILVSHSTSIIQQKCTNVLLLRNGEIIKSGKAVTVVDEYTNQNIQDFEREPSATENITNPKSNYGIISIDTYDSNHEKRSIFKSGEDIIVKVTLNLDRSNTEQLEYGLALYKEDNDLYISGINTILDKIDTSEYSKNQFYEVTYKSIVLNEGSYYFKSGIFKKNSEPLCFVNKSESTLRIVNNTNTEGIVYLNHKWSN